VCLPVFSLVYRIKQNIANVGLDLKKTELKCVIVEKGSCILECVGHGCIYVYLSDGPALSCIIVMEIPVM